MVAAIIAIALTTWGARALELRDQRERGRSVHDGQDVIGQLVGHDAALPPIALRCSNCHGAVQSAPRSAPTTPDDTGRRAAPMAVPIPARDFAPALNRAWLTETRSRRGGPASRYDAARLCELMRTGIDPSHVMISGVMPRYRLTAAQCDDLWAYLDSR